MRKICLVLCLIFCCFTVSCKADSIWDYQAVDSDGKGTHPVVGKTLDPVNRVTIEGVALAGRYETWDPNSMYIMFLQDTASDLGGMEVFSGTWYYKEGPWPLADYIDFEAGDMIRISGFIADYAGKVQMNERHLDPYVMPIIAFEIEIIGQPGLPDPQLIPSISTCNYFDQTRSGGGERYQTRFVMLHDVDVTSGTWEPGQTLTMSDETGTLDLFTLLQGIFTQPPPGKLNIVGIFDQEDGGAPYVDHYRLLLKNSSDVAAALDCCRQIRTCDEGYRIGLINKVVSAISGDGFYIQDEDRQGGVKVISDKMVSPGDVIAIQGTVTGTGVRTTIIPQHLGVISSGSLPKPLGINGRALAGDGLDVLGLKVRLCGTTGDYLGNGVYEMTTDCGSLALLQSNGVSVPGPGIYVAVTGVADLDEDGVTPVIHLCELREIQ